MDDTKESSKLIAKTLMKLFPFEQARLNMYHGDDIYHMIPRLIFRLVDSSKYNEIKSCVEAFSGELSWTLYKYEYSRTDNYIIAPVVLFELERDNLRKEECKSEKDILPIEQYRQICEKAIEDIPKLAEHIQKYFSIDFKT